MLIITGEGKKNIFLKGKTKGVAEEKNRDGDVEGEDIKIKQKIT